MLPTVFGTGGTRGKDTVTANSRKKKRVAEHIPKVLVE